MSCLNYIIYHFYVRYEDLGLKQCANRVSSLHQNVFPLGHHYVTKLKRMCCFFRSLRCSVCCDHLTNWYYEKDGKLYCRKHYWEKFGELCHGCSLLMTGPAMVSRPLSTDFLLCHSVGTMWAVGWIL